MRGFEIFEYTIGINDDDVATVVVTTEDVFANIPQRYENIVKGEGTEYKVGYSDVVLERIRFDVDGWALLNVADDLDELFEDKDMQESYAGFEADLATDAYCMALRRGLTGPGEAFDEMLRMASVVRNSFERHMLGTIEDIVEGD